MQLFGLIIFWVVIVELLIFLTGALIVFGVRLYRDWKRN